MLVFVAMWLGVGFRDLPGDLILYFDFANYIDDGRLPYRDFQMEYPPLALLPIIVAFTFGQTFDGFEAAFALETLLLALGMGALVWRLLAELLPEASPRERLWRLAAYVVAWPLLGQLVTTRIDIMPAALLVLTLYCWLRGREGWAWLTLAAGTAMKLFPVVIAPILALDLLRRRGFAAAVRGGALYLAATALLFLPGLLASPSGLWESFQYHGERGTQIESTWANALLILNHLTGFAVGTARAFGSFEAVSAWTDELKLLIPVVQVVGLGVVYVSALTPQPPLPILGEGELVRISAADSPSPNPGRGGWGVRAEYIFLPLAVFIATGKVFSPQYLIWLIPFVVLVPGHAGRWAIALFLSTLALTQVLFPYAYDHLLDRRGWAVVLLTIRNIFFLATIAVVAVAAREAQLPVMRRAQRMRREFVSGTVARRDRRA